jgi:hypothetical protein
MMLFVVLDKAFDAGFAEGYEDGYTDGEIAQCDLQQMH